MERCADRLAELGAKARRLDVRLSTHPGQYTVLNSENEAVAAQAKLEFAWHARLMDAMGLGPEAVVVIHGGSGAPDWKRALECFGGRWRTWTSRAGGGRCWRMTAGSSHSGWWSRSLAGWGSRSSGGIPERKAFEMAIATWPEGARLKVHFSSPKTAVEEVTRKKGRRVVRSLRLPSPRSHADLIDPYDFARFLADVGGAHATDVMLEAKAKDLAVSRLRARLAGLAVA